MTAPPLARRRPSAEKLARAREAAARAGRLQREQLSGHRIDVVPGLSGLLPNGSLRTGTTYSVTGSTALLAGLLAAPSAAGLWCGLVAMPDLAAEAARNLGCDLERLVMIPDPGLDWVNVVAALVDVLPVVVVRPIGAVTPAEANRLSARLRRREGVLVVAGRWPRADVALRVTGREWRGVGDGYGRLCAQRLQVATEGRAAIGSGPDERVSEVWLPDAAGEVRSTPLESSAPLRLIEAVS